MTQNTIIEHGNTYVIKCAINIADHRKQQQKIDTAIVQQQNIMEI